MTELDILFLKPGNQKKLYGKLSSSISGLEPPLWAGLLAGFIRDKGYTVKIIDAEVENITPSEIATHISEYNPFLVAIIASGTNPSASTPSMSGARSIINELKLQSPDTNILLGGLHPSALPERTMKEENVDFVCEGEGFHTILELLETLKTNKHDYNIQGLWYRNNNKIVKNPRSPLIKNLDDLPFVAWDLLPMEKYRAHNWHCFGHLEERQPYAVIYTSLGCPFNCRFCCINSIFGGPGIRFRSPDKVIEEIDYLVKNYNMKNIKILDECFVFKKKHVLEICDLIIQRGYDLNIWAYARIDTIDENMLRKMKQAGINWLGFGIEAGSNKVRNGVTKGRFNQNDIRKAIAMTHAAGIHVGANFIFGLPDDDTETMQETLDMAKELNCEYTNFYVAMAYPGSQLYKDALLKNIKLPDTWLGYAQFSAETLPLPTKHLSNAEVLRFRDRAFEEYHSSPTYLEMIVHKFGQETAAYIEGMLKHKLKRNLFQNEKEINLGKY